MRGAFVIALAGHAIDIPAAAASTAYGRPSLSLHPIWIARTSPDELPVPDARFFQVPESCGAVTVRCGCVGGLGWFEVRLCDPCAGLSLIACGFHGGFPAPPRCLTGTPGLGLSHVRTRGFLLGPINDVQQ